MSESSNETALHGAKSAAGFLIPAGIVTVFNAIAAYLVAKANLSERLLAIQPIGTVSEQAAMDGLWGILPYFMLCALIVLIGLVSCGALPLVLLFMRGGSRWRVAGTLAIAVVNCAFWPIGCRASSRTEYTARTEAFRAVAQRAAPLVAALDQYKTNEGSYPPSLDVLAPEYIAAIPDTNLSAYPKFEYEFSPRIRNPRGYSLLVRCSVGGMNWDAFYYAPEKDEDSRPQANRLERIDDWIYVHE